jgi:hypothetical protein
VDLVELSPQPVEGDVIDIDLDGYLEALPVVPNVDLIPDRLVSPARAWAASAASSRSVAATSPSEVSEKRRMNVRAESLRTRVVASP